MGSQASQGQSSGKAYLPVVVGPEGPVLVGPPVVSEGVVVGAVALGVGELAAGPDVTVELPAAVPAVVEF